MPKRFIPAMILAVFVTFLTLWIGARLAGTILTPDSQPNDFTRGQKMMLCGRVVDTRHEISEYDFDVWQGSRCKHLSELEECLLDCLSDAGTIEIGHACYSDCVLR